MIYILEATETKTWSDASDYCLSLGAQLLEVRTQEHYDVAFELRHVLDDRYWIGGRETLTEGNFTWNSIGDPVATNEDFWFSDRPEINTNLNCLQMQGRGPYDTNCNSLRPYICEYV